jgi:hypothetical protein
MCYAIKESPNDNMKSNFVIKNGLFPYTVLMVMFFCLAVVIRCTFRSLVNTIPSTALS